MFNWTDKGDSSLAFSGYGLAWRNYLFAGAYPAYSTQTGHLFQAKLDTCSTPSWTLWAQRRGVEVWFYSGLAELVKFARFFRSESPFKLS